jgi:V8-like Glu-specific endopeptidase
MLRFLSFLFAITMVASNAFAFPLPNGSEVAPTLFTTNYNFEGIVRLSNCSGSLVRFENSKPSDLGLVMTNGHCLDLGGFLEPGQVVTEVPMNRRFGLYNDKAEIVGYLQSTQIVYGTMTNTDVSFYRLTQTYQQIKDAYNVNPLVLSSEKANVGSEIEVISGYWKRGYSCGIEYFVNQLNEDSWTFRDSIRYTRPGCETIGGTSGSPIISPITRKVIGINNTGNESGELCTMNNPCEVDADGNKKAYHGVSYGQQIYWVYSCLTEDNQFDLNKEGCLLPH